MGAGAPFSRLTDLLPTVPHKVGGAYLGSNVVIVEQALNSYQQHDPKVIKT